MNDILARPSLDPGQRTLGQLMHDCEGAVHEIRRLRNELEQLGEKQKLCRQLVDARHELAAAYAPGALIRLAELSKLLGVARSTIYKCMAEGSFPRPVRVSERAVRWRMEDIESWRDRLPSK
jgi:predicted DNA-binding transcriptional regulator AlpA